MSIHSHRSLPDDSQQQGIMAVRGGVEAFTDRLPSLVRERSMARERGLLVDSHALILNANAEKTRAEAELTRAQAQRVSAESEVLLAEAHEERQRTKRKDALLRELRRRNIDFLAEQQGSILRICCTKGSDDGPEEVDS